MTYLEFDEPLLTPGEVAAIWRVEPRTVARWARAGKLPAVRTLGGHRRFREAEVRALLGDDSHRATRAVAADDPAVTAALGYDLDIDAEEER